MAWTWLKSQTMVTGCKLSEWEIQSAGLTMGCVPVQCQIRMDAEPYFEEREHYQDLGSVCGFGSCDLDYPTLYMMGDHCSVLRDSVQMIPVVVDNDSAVAGSDPAAAVVAVASNDRTSGHEQN